MNNNYSIDAIARLLQKGGGVSRVRIRENPESTTIRQAFVSQGWSSQYVARTFARLTDRHVEEYTPLEFISEWAHYTISTLEDIEDLQDGLQSLGLRSEIIARLLTVVLPLQNTSYTNDQLLDIAIEYLLQETHPRIQPIRSGFFTEPDVVNTWFHDSSRTIAYMNINGPCLVQRREEIISILSTIPTVTNSNLLFFYHTTSWHGTQNILTGLSHKVGRTCTDFGVLPGFYMSDTLQTSLEWGERNVENYSGQVGIVIFALPQLLPSAFRVCDLKDSDWVKITKKSRRCKNKKVELAELRGCHFVYGDMVANPGPVKKRSMEPATHIPPKKQFVSKHDLADEYLQTRIVACLYFQEQATVAAASPT